MEVEKRKLIKFSNYSFCVTLPKSLIKALKWDKGDVVNLEVDEKAGSVLIYQKKHHPKKNQETTYRW